MKRRTFVALPALALAPFSAEGSPFESPGLSGGTMPVFAERLKAELTFPRAYRPGRDRAWPRRAREKFEELLWQPERQEAKTTHRGDCEVVRYRAFGVKDRLVARFRQLLADGLPGCPIRYIF